MAAATLDPEKTLSWERRHRTRAAIAALLGTLGLLVYFISGEVLRADGPRISGLDAIVRGAQPGRVAELESLRVAEFQYLQDNQLLVLGIGIGGLVGFIGMAWVAGFLGVAVRGRAAEFKRFLVYVPIIGGVVLGLGTLIVQGSVVVLTNEFMDGTRTVEEATRPQNSFQQFGQIMFSIGSLLLAVGLVIISLNAMRVGLLTKLFGYLGIVAGAMFVIYPLPVVQVFWVAGLGVLFLGRWPGGDPPAWRTGKAEPWPTAAELAQARAERLGHAAPQPAPAQAPKAPSAGRSKRKKRS
ncbi:hypothetical protein DVA67_021305 [Solirubrobacter sp. CPCC 204708]|uniref:DUF4386 family protein n=1 Tax=Solirubrobacter deserti TaxID=2282478 RepID=A0ABT4RF97_9ACTN|nr:hypothetical protein [Solirubrobacter deserti]MBE2318532.1 hypothetical protein [Solirubrobacter deserti]MDA0136990.1 hypothetical protein [Solirubrobacter deserti]